MAQSLTRRISQLALPVALQSVMVSLLGMSDVFMVAGLGASAIGAVGLGAKLHFVIIMVMASLGTAISVLVAQYFGRGNHEASRHILLIGALSGLAVLMPIAVAFFVFPDVLLSFLSDDAELIDFGATYLRITIPLLFLTHIIIAFESGMRARGETVTPLVLATIAIALNIVLNYVLIHGVGPFPQLGVQGVAIASDIARFVQVILLLSYLSYVGHSYALRPMLRGLVEAKRYINKFFTTAWPLTLNFTLWGMGTFMYHGIAARSGTEALAALSLISPIEGMYHSLFFGLVTACSVLVGQHLGRNEFAEAKQMAMRFALFSPMGSLLIGGLILLASPLFMPMLLDPSESLYQLCMQLLWVMCLTFWIKVLNMTVIVGMLRAGGDSKYVLYTDMLSMWTLGIPAMFVAAFVFELPYVWVYAMVLVEEIAKAILVVTRARRGKWLKNLTYEEEPIAPPQASAA